MRLPSKLAGVVLLLGVNFALAGTVTISDGTNTLIGRTQNNATISANGDIDITSFTLTSGCLGDACNPNAPPTPSCTISASPTSVTAGNSVLLKANCSGFTPTTYAWMAGGASICVNATDNTCTDTPATTTNYQLVASDGATPAVTATTTKSITVTAAGTPGAVDCSNQPPLANAAPVSTTKMQLITKLNTAFFDQIPSGKLNPYLFKNTRGLTSGRIDVIATGGFVAIWISQCPGASNASLPAPCKRSRSSGSGTLYVSGNSNVTKNGTPACMIDPSQTYYLNIQNAPTGATTGVQAALYSD